MNKYIVAVKNSKILTMLISRAVTLRLSIRGDEILMEEISINICSIMKQDRDILTIGQK